MKIYRVGGCVRDHLMGEAGRDRDWVVVGATPDDMLAAGFRKVGKDFPVFLHPETREEYALARARRRYGGGRRGLGVEAHVAATIEDDLGHRDFTMNAMAIDEDGRLIDPLGGQQDLRNKVIRHAGSTFGEDPIRVLRAARFAARYADFTVAPETLDMLGRLGQEGALAALQPERVWAELVKALAAPAPVRFVEVLRQAAILDKVFPEIDALFGVPQPAAHHPEIDTGLHTIMVLAQAGRLTADPIVRFAALVHDLGKGATPREQWPHHLGHEGRGVDLVKGFVRRLRGSNQYLELGVLAARWHGPVHRAAELRPGTLLKVLDAADAFKRPDRLEALLTTCKADARGRKGREDQPYPQAEVVRRAFGAARRITASGLIDQGEGAGPELGALLRQKRIEAIKAALRPAS
ncbi:MAG: multifunctional CCA addition/repair protein [Alphaproteobacteria bacterium]|jgi:tRNA nucleotidyltransferase (CCA-adding enzyme)|nr:multifunctional CCA addition/repair protein [Alphaproteobacteria bacterium]MDP6564994.1 multifunctional CCA addition/repair protein [Alphaproteobacteria bacterium]